MISLSAALQAVHAGAVQKPAWLVYLGFSSPLRLSSFDDVSYDGNNWSAYDVDVSRIRIDAVRIAGELVIQNADDAIGALILNEGVADKTVKIYGYDAGATATDDIVHLITCVGGAATISHDRVTISLRSSASFTASPREFVNAASGFTYLIPIGTQLRINGQIYKVER